MNNGCTIYSILLYAVSFLEKEYVVPTQESVSDKYKVQYLIFKHNYIAIWRCFYNIHVALIRRI